MIAAGIVNGRLQADIGEGGSILCLRIFGIVVMDQFG